MKAKAYLRALLPLAALSFASLTKADTVRTLKADGSQNNANIYSSRQEVWIGVQDGTSFEQDGIYFFGVTIPSSSAATSLLANDGVANSDERYTVLTSGSGQNAVSTPVAPNMNTNPADPWGWLSRIMIVENGKIVGATAHAVQTDPRNNGGTIVQLWPYAPSNNNEYKIWMVHISQVTVKYRIGSNDVQTTSAVDYATNIMSNPAAVLLQAFYPNSKGTSTDNFKVIEQSTNGPTLQLICPSSPNIAVCPSAQGANVTLGNANAIGLGQGGTFVLDSMTFASTDTQAPVSVPFNSTTGQHFFPVGSTTVTISGHDSSAPSSTASCSFFVVVEATDVDAPVPSVANIDVSGQCSVTVTAPKATDNCSSSLITGTTSDPLTYTQQGVYQITWTFTDASGNSSTQKQTVTVNDTIKPVPTLATLPTATGVCSVTLDVPTATDNCAGLIQGTTAQKTFTGETDTTVTWTYNDGHGNTITQTQRVIVHDDVAPIISAPSSFQVNTDPGLCSAVVTFDWSAGDNCSLKSSSINIASGSSFPKGSTTVTINAEDAAGNKSTKSFVVTVVDNQAPIAPVLSPITGECSASAPAPKATDNCDQGHITGVPNGPTSFNVEGTYTIIWTFTDAAGNSSTASQTVTVTDKTALVKGTLFNDHNTPNTLQDAGDPGLAGWTVTLKQGATTVATTTSLADGSYKFTDLHSGTYTVVVTVPATWTGTAPSSNTVTVSCGGTASFNFGCYCLGTGGALSKGFWTSKNGQAVFASNTANNLAKLALYALRDTKGALIAPAMTSYSQVSSFLNNATATNMTSMLSAQLAAVVLDIEPGNQAAGAKFLLGCNGGKLVSLVNGTANSGNASLTAAIQAAFPANFATIDAVVAKAQALLVANDATDVATQTAVKNVLDAICNNTNFVQ